MQEDVQAQASPRLVAVAVAAVVAGIHLFTHRLRHWRELPLAEFCTWLLVMSVMLVVLLGLPKGELAERAFNLSFLMMVATAPFWVVLGLEVIDLAVTIPRWLVLGPCRRLPGGAFHGSAVLILAAQTLFVCFVCLATWGGTFLGLPSGALSAWPPPWLGAWQSYLAYASAFDLFLLMPLLLWAVIRGVRRRWTLRVATTVLILSIAAPVITFGGSLALWGGKDFVEAGL